MYMRRRAPLGEQALEERMRIVHHLLCPELVASQADTGKKAFITNFMRKQLLDFIWKVFVLHVK